MRECPSVGDIEITLDVATSQSPWGYPISNTKLGGANNNKSTTKWRSNQVAGRRRSNTTTKDWARSIGQGPCQRSGDRSHRRLLEHHQQGARRTEHNWDVEEWRKQGPARTEKVRKIVSWNKSRVSPCWVDSARFSAKNILCRSTQPSWGTEIQYF